MFARVSVRLVLGVGGLSTLLVALILLVTDGHDTEAIVGFVSSGFAALVGYRAAPQQAPRDADKQGPERPARPHRSVGRCQACRRVIRGTDLGWHGCLPFLAYQCPVCKHVQTRLT